MKQDFVLATIDPPSVFNFYETMAAAESDQERAIGSESKPYKPMTWEAFESYNRTFWLSGPPVQITAEKFMEMLEVLPPIFYGHHGGFESFLMSEFTSGSFTEQYAKLGDAYWSKMVDAGDRSTWMTAADLQGVKTKLAADREVGETDAMEV